MSFYRHTEQSILRGSVADLMASTDVGPRVQPWYTPLNVDAHVTGMATGGIEPIPRLAIADFHQFFLFDPFPAHVDATRKPAPRSGG